MAAAPPSHELHRTRGDLARALETPLTSPLKASPSSAAAAADLVPGGGFREIILEQKGTREAEGKDAEADVHDGDAGDGLEEHRPELPPVRHGRLQRQREAEPLEAEHGDATRERGAPEPRERAPAVERPSLRREEDLNILLNNGGDGEDGAGVGEDAEGRERGEGADEGERHLRRQQEREHDGGRRQGGEHGADVLADEDEVGDGAACLAEDDDGLCEVPAGGAEAPLAQITVGVAAASTMAMLCFLALLLLCLFLLTQLVSAIQLQKEREVNTAAYD